MSDQPHLAGNIERVRLHISPFNPELLDRIIAPSLQPLASKISCHAVQTFPERGFGYLELPFMEAQKLKKRLNGSTLKGAKVRVEDARPEKKRKLEDDGVEEESKKSKKKAKKEKKQREEGVLPGQELEEGRRVKRGWTEGGIDGKKDKKKSRSSGDAENASEGRKLRFKTALPDDAAPVEVKSKDKAETKKKDKEGKKGKKKVVVDEFAKSSKPATHTRVDSAGHGAIVYVDGKGWVNEAGDVVEAERQSRKPKRPKPVEEKEPRVSAIESREMLEHATPERASPSSSSSGDDDDERMSFGALAAEAAQLPSQDSDVHDVEAEADRSESTKEVHPLEALFKRPMSSPTDAAKPRPKPINTSFSFFSTGPADDKEDVGVAMPPQTPHTRQDMEWRSIRSAAPTPDTAAIGRKLSFPFAQGHVDEDGEEGVDAEMTDAQDQAEGGAVQAGRSGESAFKGWYFENRGDTNRAWKKERREGRKVKRQRENRSLSRRIV